MKEILLYKAAHYLQSWLHQQNLNPVVKMAVVFPTKRDALNAELQFARQARDAGVFVDISKDIRHIDRFGTVEIHFVPEDTLVPAAELHAQQRTWVETHAVLARDLREARAKIAQAAELALQDPVKALEILEGATSTPVS